MTKLKDDYNIDDIINILKTYVNNFNSDSINKAYELIKNNLDLKEIQDILNVSYILTTVYADVETIISNFLYHLLLNNKVNKKYLEDNFEYSIIKLSEGIEKLNKITLSTENDYLVEYYKKVIVGMSEDVRMITVVLADRVYLMRKLSEYSDAEIKKIAKETLEIFAPISHHLGVYKLKSELEDLSLRYLKPEVYYDIVEKLNSTKGQRDSIIQEMMDEVSDILNNHNIKFEIKGRSKSIYSIYNKLDKGKKFSDIYDLLALRVLVNTEQECYLVLGLIHSKFKPIPKRFKDFIAMPKPNGYQSLHTTVFGVNNDLFEIQIRTYDMNEVAENGLAAHWSYKEHRKASNLSSTDQKLVFFKSVIDMNNDNTKDNILETIQDDSMHDNIYVFTPKGDVIELPKGSTPVDFAYRVHSKVGDQMVGALVNNTIVPLNYELQDNDVVKINTSKLSTGPSLGWLEFAKLSTTKNKIKAFFSKNRKDELISLGKDTLEKYLRKNKISINEFLNDKNIKKILKELKISDMESLYINIGNNKTTPKTIVGIIYKEEEHKDINTNQVIEKNELDINVSGLKDIKVNIASCCKPVPGDKIIGYITKNNGITVHRDNCSNLIHLEERIVDVEFNSVTKNRYLTTIVISLKNNQTKLGDILNKITNRNLFIESITTLLKEEKTLFKVNLYVLNKEILDRLIQDITKLRYVESCERE